MDMENQIRELRDAMNKPKDVNEILEEQIASAMREHNRPAGRLFLSSISAGLEIGFSVFLMAVFYTLFHDVLHPSGLHVLLAVAYPVGFMFVIIGKSELFTEHTTLAVVPVLNRSASVRSLLVLWGIVYAGNLLGGYVFSIILNILPDSMEYLEPGAFLVLAEKLYDHPWVTIAGSGILAGWLMGLLSWLNTSAKDTVSRIILVFLVTTVIGIGGLHHSIVGSIEVFTAYLSSAEVGLPDYLRVQWWATLGNVIGGVVFVALMKFSHVSSKRDSVDSQV
jgi:formate/nitrite transporter FocA (FNT family)